ncbi:MAG: hypothetical protein CL903_04935 [Dehalococcoidia bacterium]|nr:hypothetical protein [Dehalococcoidia bacterium]|tara:strand:+ start:187 stop:993 length:807 start_codon:yes stop_codon:yes gene_type:complete
MRFKDKVILLTGSAACDKNKIMGFGGATVWRFFEEGGRAAIITDVQEELGKESESLLRSHGHDATYMNLDVTKNEDWQKVISHIDNKYSRLDILVNIAGILDPKSIMDIDIKLWEKTMQISTLGIFLGVRNSANLIEKSGGGSIVNISSMGALQGSNAYGSAYGFSRGGMINFTKSAAMQLADKNIRVNVVMPGWVHTPFTDYLYNDEIQSEHRVSQVPLKRWGKPSDIAAAILFLSSDDASYMTGSQMLVDGGVTAGRMRIANPLDR